jgi:hypothetical protein
MKLLQRYVVSWWTNAALNVVPQETVKLSGPQVFVIDTAKHWHCSSGHKPVPDQLAFIELERSVCETGSSELGAVCTN